MPLLAFTTETLMTKRMPRDPGEPMATTSALPFESPQAPVYFACFPNDILD